MRKIFRNSPKFKMLKHEEAVSQAPVLLRWGSGVFRRRKKTNYVRGLTTTLSSTLFLITLVGGAVKLILGFH